MWLRLHNVNRQKTTNTVKFPDIVATHANTLVASDLGLGGGFCCILPLPPPLTIGRKSDDNQNSMLLSDTYYISYF